MIITAIDTSDTAGWLARWFPAIIPRGTIVDMRMKPPERTIQEIILRSKGQKISRLNIIDHGNKNALQMGETVIDADNFSYHRSAFSRLKGRFEPEGFIHLLHCEVGWAFELLEKIASTTGVTVYGGRSLTQAAGLQNLGGLHGVFPNGGGLCINQK